MNAGVPALQAALEAGYTRIRPVMMTALAMIIGMVPMALGFGEGGEQNAPLGRAVIGGLLFATVATLFFVPSVFTIIHGRRESTAAVGNRGRPRQKQGRTESREIGDLNYANTTAARNDAAERSAAERDGGRPPR